jgi:membrane fusion protein, heavy metal efflux system
MKCINFLASAIVFLSACGVNEKTDESAGNTDNQNMVQLTDEQIKNAGIKTGQAQERDISVILKVNGKIDVPPQNMVSISVPLGGYLKTTKLLPGMHVRKGETIAVVEDQQYIQLQQDYLTAKAKIGYLENEYNRQKELNRDQASSDKIYQQAEAEFKTHQVLIASLSQKLRLAGIYPDNMSEKHISRSVNIISPINGFVSKVNVNIGKYVSPTDVLFELVNPADIHLNLSVFEKDIEKLYIGQKLTAYTNNQPDKKYRCEILLIGKHLTAEGNTEVHCHFETYDKLLIPGTYMNAEIAIKSAKAFLLPETAVVRFEGEHYIYQYTGEKKYEMIQVTIGESQNGFTEIRIPDTSRLRHATYVTSGAYSLLMAMKNKAE